MKKSLEFCIYQCHINDLQEKLEKINQEIKEKTEALDNIRNGKINSENEKSLLRQNKRNFISNYKLIIEKKQAIMLEISEYKAKEKFLDKDLNENQEKKVGEKGGLTQNKKKIEAANKEINSLQQKRLSLMNELKTLESFSILTFFFFIKNYR